MLDEESFYLPTGAQRASVFARILRALNSLPKEQQWTVTIKKHKPRRSLPQNALLWSLYTDILKLGGPEMEGWEKEDLHQFFLIRHFGEEIKEMFGEKRRVPLRTSSGLNKQEFTDFIDSVVRFMAERGVVLHLPGDDEHG